MSKPSTRYLKTFLKLAFVAGLLYFLGKKGLISIDATQRAFSHGQQLATAFGVMGSMIFIGVLRWQLLLKAQGIRLPYRRIFELAMVGNFFNIALPGAVSGDFVKAFYIAREIEGKRARAFGSILFDRVAGLSALVLVSATALGLGAQSLWDTPLFRGTKLLLAGAAACVIGFYAYLFLVRERHDPLLKLFQVAEARFEKLGSLTRIYESLRHYHDHRATVLQVLGLSMVIHCLIGYGMINLAAAFDEGHLPFLALYVAFPLGLLVTAIPVLPAGVGTGHAAFAYLFGLIGSQRGADVFSLYALFQLFTGGIGGLFYLRFRTHEPKPVFDAASG